MKTKYKRITFSFSQLSYPHQYRSLQFEGYRVALHLVIFKRYFRSSFKNLRYSIPNFDPNTRESISFYTESRFFSMMYMLRHVYCKYEHQNRFERLEFQNIIRSNVFICIIHKTTNRFII